MIWKQSFEVPADGPDAALVRVVRLLKLPYSRLHINRSILEHRQPSTLLALVEVATGLGLKTTPARVDPDALGELTRPLIVHFGSPGSEGGFGVLEATSPHGYTVWDSVNGLRVMTRDVFLASWSGVVVLVERGETRGPREKGYVRRRLFELVVGRMARPSLVGKQAIPALRAVVLVLLGVLLAVSVAAQPAESRVGAIALVMLSFVGLVVTIVTAASVADQRLPLSTRVCKRGKLIDCEGVLTSRYSRVFGIPLGEVGIAFYGSILLLLATGAAGGTYAPWHAAGVAYVATLPAAALLIGAQLSLKQLCTLCLAVHTVNVCGALAAWQLLPQADRIGAETLSSLLLTTLFFFVVLFVVIPYVTSGTQLEALAGAHRRILGSPFATLAQLRSETPTNVRGAECGVPLGDSTGEHELVIFVHPGCSRCGPVLEQVRALMPDSRLNIFAALAPHSPDDADRDTCTAVVAAGLALGQDGMFRAYTIAKESQDRFSEDPVRLLAEALEEPEDRIGQSVGRARRLVRRAEELADEHLDGTPALFFDSQPIRGPVSHLSFLLAHHADLLSGAAMIEGALLHEVRGETGK